jgi:hypothetical protein
VPERAEVKATGAEFGDGMNDEEFLARFSEEERRVWFTLSPEDQAAVRASYTQHIPPTDELRALTHQLFVRASAGDGRILRREDFMGANVHECLNNAIAWVKAHPGHRLVYGFLFFHFGYQLPHVRFTPHVAVETENGEWLDVTPHNAEDDYPFLQHAGTEPEFAAALQHGPMDLVYRR